MAAIHTLEIAITPDAIDENRHVNNLEYLRWMQDVAMDHSAGQGWPMKRYFDLGATWVVRSHFVEYLLPAFQGDALDVHTWVADMGNRSSTRRYLFWRQRDHRIIARAETLWVFVDFHSGRPRPIPAELRADFELGPAEEPEVLRHLGLQRADDGAPQLRA